MKSGFRFFQRSRILNDKARLHTTMSCLSHHLVKRRLVLSSEGNTATTSLKPSTRLAGDTRKRFDG